MLWWLSCRINWMLGGRSYEPYCSRTWADWINGVPGAERRMAILNIFEPMHVFRTRTHFLERYPEEVIAGSTVDGALYLASETAPSDIAQLGK